MEHAPTNDPNRGERIDEPSGSGGGSAIARVGSRGIGGAGAWSSKKAWFTLLLVSAGSLGIDLLTKWLAFKSIAGQPVVVDRSDVLQLASQDPRLVGSLVPPHEPLTIIPSVLDLTLVLNPGAVFGVGPGKRWFFVTFTAVALSFGLWMFAKWTRTRDTLAHAAIGLLLGGGLGNLYDRLALGCVRDFLHPLPGLKWPGGWKPFGGNGQVWPYVSNVADLLLLIGIGMLLVFLWRKPMEQAGGESTKAGM